MYLKKIKDLISCDYDIEISGITDDSRKVKDNYLFVATKGYYIDHFNYIGDAIKNGAVVIITDRDIDFDIPYIKVENVNEAYPLLCSKYYNVDLSKLTFIGITGTDGKTTTATIVKRLLDNLQPTAYIGTNGVEFCNTLLPTDNTTPCISELYAYLKEIINSGCRTVVMEVSSEALLHNRVAGLEYKIVGFTNITEDHLNIHKSLNEYVACKSKLLDYLDSKGIAIFNGDDKKCKVISKNNSNIIVLYGVGVSNNCIVSNVKLEQKVTIFDIKYLGNIYKIKSPFMGIYNVYNVTLAFLICLHLGFCPEYLVDAISKLEPVSGRGELLSFGQKFTIILDYAHTYNGIKNIISSIEKEKYLIVVTGCAGGREKEKRKKIGNYILNHADIAIFTMDDPREEDVDKIIDEMIEGNTKKYIRLINRKEAIYKAFDLAKEKENSIVLVLGKGRDNYMAIGKEKVPYCDYDVIKSYFEDNVITE